MRLHDWESRLTLYVAEVARTGFAHGAHDCALFAAGAVAAVTGIDPGARWRGHYSSFKGGLKLVRKAGFTDHVAVMRQHCPQVHAANPTVAQVTNVYDTLERVQTQTNAMGKVWTYHFAGSRTQELGPLGQSRVHYFNGAGKVLKAVTPTGKITTNTHASTRKKARRSQI